MQKERKKRNSIFLVLIYLHLPGKRQQAAKRLTRNEIAAERQAEEQKVGARWLCISHKLFMYQ